MHAPAMFKIPCFSHTNPSVLSVLTLGWPSCLLFPYAGAVTTTVPWPDFAVDVIYTQPQWTLFPIRTAVWSRKISMENVPLKSALLQRGQGKLERNKRYHWDNCAGLQSSKTHSPNWHRLELLSDSFSDPSDMNPSQNKYCVTQRHQRLRK